MLEGPIDVRGVPGERYLLGERVAAAADPSGLPPSSVWPHNARRRTFAGPPGPDPVSP